MTPMTTLAPVANILSATRKRSPKGRLSGLNRRIFPAWTTEEKDWRRIFTTFLAVVKKILHTVVTILDNAPVNAPS